MTNVNDNGEKYSAGMESNQNHSAIIVLTKQ